MCLFCPSDPVTYIGRIHVDNTAQSHTPFICDICHVVLFGVDKNPLFKIHSEVTVDLGSSWPQSTSYTSDTVLIVLYMNVTFRECLCMIFDSVVYSFSRCCQYSCTAPMSVSHIVLCSSAVRQWTVRCWDTELRITSFVQQSAACVRTSKTVPMLLANMSKCVLHSRILESVNCWRFVRLDSTYDCCL